LFRKHTHEHGPMPHERASHLLNPLRKLILSPKKLVKRLELRKDAKVLELGPGPGYFSLEVARSIPAGILVMVDIQQEMLDMASKRLEKEGITNVDYIKGDAASLPADNEFFDVAFLVSVLGEVPDRSQCLRELYRVLHPQGRLSVTEQPGAPDFISRPEIQRLAVKEGFQVETTYGWSKNYTVNFKKPDGSD